MPIYLFILVDRTWSLRSAARMVSTSVCMLRKMPLSVRSVSPIFFTWSRLSCTHTNTHHKQISISTRHCRPTSRPYSPTHTHPHPPPTYHTCTFFTHLLHHLPLVCLRGLLRGHVHLEPLDLVHECLLLPAPPLTAHHQLLPRLDQRTRRTVQLPQAVRVHLQEYTHIKWEDQCHSTGPLRMLQLQRTRTRR